MDKTTHKGPRQHSNKKIAEYRNSFDPNQVKITAKRMRLAARIEDGMIAKNWNRKHFAEQMTVNPSVITLWLSGTHNFTTDTLFAIEDKLGISLVNASEEMAKQDIQRFTSVAHAGQHMAFTNIEHDLNQVQFLPMDTQLVMNNLSYSAAVGASLCSYLSFGNTCNKLAPDNNTVRFYERRRPWSGLEKKEY